MKRHPALQDLSRDHFTALLRATHVRRAVAGDPLVPSLEEAQTAFLALWRDELELHFQEEEHCLVPVMAAAAGAGTNGLLDRIHAEHSALREGFRALEAGAEPASWQQVAEELAVHARWEEEHFFHWFQENLDDAGLQALWDASRAFRTRTRGLDSIGPRSGCRPGDVSFG